MPVNFNFLYSVFNLWPNSFFCFYSQSPTLNSLDKLSCTIPPK